MLFIGPPEKTCWIALYTPTEPHTQILHLRNVASCLLGFIHRRNAGLAAVLSGSTRGTGTHLLVVFHLSLRSIDTTAHSSKFEVSYGPIKIRVGQVWSREDDGATYLVTRRCYNEALTTFALLRPTEDQGGQGDLPPLPHQG